MEMEAAGGMVVGGATGGNQGGGTINAIAYFDDGVIVLKGGRKHIYIPASDFIPTSANGAACGTFTVGSNPNSNIFQTCDFDTSADEYAQFAIQMPKSWDEGAMIAQIIWSHPSTATNFGISMWVEAVAYSNSDPANTNFGTAREMQDTGGTTSDIFHTPEVSSLLPAGSISQEDLVLFQIFRDVSDAGDTLAVDARIHGIKLFYEVVTGNDQ